MCLLRLFYFAKDTCKHVKRLYIEGLMKIIDLIQGSKEWHEYRSCRIGASDAPIIMGLSTYCTPSLLYKRKKGLAPPQKPTFAMQKGTDLEPTVRKDAEDFLHVALQPLVVEMEGCPFLFASLDGCTLENKTLVEIKVSKNLYAEAKKGIIPPMYFCQMQHQMMVLEFDQCIYFVSDDGFGFIHILVKRDDIFIEKMKQKLLEFYACLQNDEEPFDENAYMTIDIDEEKNEVVDRWVRSLQKLKEAEKEEKHYSEVIQDWGDDSNCKLVYDGTPKLKMTRVQRMGNVDWKALCMAKGIVDNDIAPFRKKEIGYYKLSEIRT